MDLEKFLPGNYRLVGSEYLFRSEVRVPIPKFRDKPRRLEPRGLLDSKVFDT